MAGRNPPGHSPFQSATTAAEAVRVPVPPGARSGPDPVRGGFPPCDRVRDGRGQLLLAAGAHIGLAGGGPRDLLDDPLTIARVVDPTTGREPG